MARELDSIKEISDAKELWKLAVRIEDMWSVVNQFKMEHVEFLILDKQGDNIQVLLPTEQLPTWKPKLEEGQTYIMKNFRVLENDFTVKSSEHPYKLVFIAGDGGTDVIRQEIPDIPFHKFKFKPFIEIHNGNYRPDRLVDIIGVVHEITQVPNTSGPKKLPTTFTISDTGCNKLTVTLWDDYGASFMKSFNEKGGEGPFVVILKHARIKEAQGNFGLTITNAWNGTKLIIDSQLPEVKDFVQSLSEDFLSQTPALSQSGPTQMMSPHASASSMYTTAEKYTYRAPPKHLSELMTLPEEFMCTTVATPHHIMASRNGWYYLSCTVCSKGVIPTAKGYECKGLGEQKHQFENPIIKYKVEVEVRHEGHKMKFVYWDHDCTQLIGETAAQLRQKMQQAGVWDPHEYPRELDFLITKEPMAYKIKMQASHRQGSILNFRREDEYIQHILQQISNSEDNTSPTSGDLSLTPSLSQNDVSSLIPIQDLSASSETDPENKQMITPAKRSSPDHPCKNFFSY